MQHGKDGLGAAERDSPPDDSREVRRLAAPLETLPMLIPMRISSRMKSAALLENAAFLSGSVALATPCIMRRLALARITMLTLPFGNHYTKSYNSDKCDSVFLRVITLEFAFDYCGSWRDFVVAVGAKFKVENPFSCVIDLFQLTFSWEITIIQLAFS